MQYAYFEKIGEVQCCIVCLLARSRSHSHKFIGSNYRTYILAASSCVSCSSSRFSIFSLCVVFFLFFVCFRKRMLSKIQFGFNTKFIIAHNYNDFESICMRVDGSFVVYAFLCGNKIHMTFNGCALCVDELCSVTGGVWRSLFAGDFNLYAPQSTGTIFRTHTHKRKNRFQRLGLHQVFSVGSPICLCTFDICSYAFHKI